MKTYTFKLTDDEIALLDKKVLTDEVMTEEETDELEALVSYMVSKREVVDFEEGRFDAALKGITDYNALGPKSWAPAKTGGDFNISTGGELAPAYGEHKTIVETDKDTRPALRSKRDSPLGYKYMSLEDVYCKSGQGEGD